MPILQSSCGFAYWMQLFYTFNKVLGTFSLSHTKNLGQMQHVIEKTWKVTLLIDTPYKGISTWNLPRQTLDDICSLDDGSSPRTYSQKLGQPSPAYFYVQKGLLFEWWSVCMWKRRLGWRRFLLCGVGAFQVQRKNQCGP